ncbi:MAG TPA: type II toxin-antitoxin system HigB family toxin [Candidatus Angelobacter sp.]
MPAWRWVSFVFPQEIRLINKLRCIFAYRGANIKFAYCEEFWYAVFNSNLKSRKLKVVGTGVIDKAVKQHGDLSGPLAAWLKIAKQETWVGLNDIRKTLPKTDEYNKKFIFNIKGNSYRLIASINFRSQTLFVEYVLTHAEYDKGGWK